DLPQKLEDIISKALEKDRNLRYQSAADIRADLQRLKRDTDSGRAVAHSSDSVPVAQEAHAPMAAHVTSASAVRPASAAAPASASSPVAAASSASGSAASASAVAAPKRSFK